MDLLFQMRVFSNVTYLHGIRLKFRNILFNSLTKMELEVKFALRPKKHYLYIIVAFWHFSLLLQFDIS